MIRWLLGLVGLCPHAHRLYVRNEDQRLLLACERCGHAVPALRVDSDYQADAARRIG